MACATSQSMLTANSCCVFGSGSILKKPTLAWGRVKCNSSSSSRLFIVNASSTGTEEGAEADCNAVECAPDKEVGKVSMDWLANDKTKVAGTFPPRKKGWTGYIEKDTAGQTNIYSIEPAVYVAESAISSGSAGTSSEGSENNAAIAAGLALISIAAASSVLLQVGKNEPQVQASYSGSPLSYYINKFKTEKIVEASVPPEPQALALEASTPTEPSSSTPDATAMEPSSSTVEAEASPISATNMMPTESS